MTVLADTPEKMSEWLLSLVEAGADIIHCSQRRFWEAQYPEIDGVDGLNFAGWAKKLTGAATISVGSVGLTGDILTAFAGEGSKSEGLEVLIRRMERDEFDLIAVGRALLNYPLWADKIRTGNHDALMDLTPGTILELVWLLLMGARIQKRTDGLVKPQPSPFMQRLSMSPRSSSGKLPTSCNPLSYCRCLISCRPCYDRGSKLIAESPRSFGLIMAAWLYRINLICFADTREKLTVWFITLLPCPF